MEKHNENFKIIKTEAVKIPEMSLEIYYSLAEEKIEKEDRYAYTITCRSDDDVVVLSDITSEKDRACEILKQFADGSVTPISAYDVAEELLP